MLLDHPIKCQESSERYVCECAHQWATSSTHIACVVLCIVLVRCSRQASFHMDF
ncbi:hypothetical protein PAXRUDRAFT_836394, partial [Paxillus rubicundulus Ve08.2h10]